MRVLARTFDHDGVCRRRRRRGSPSAGPIDCAVKTVRAEGPLALYKGFVPAYARLGPWQLVFFLTFEKVNALASLGEL